MRLKIYQELGNDKEAEKIVLDNFRKSKSMSTLEEVLPYLKEEQKQKFIDSEVKSICESNEFSMQDLNFLIELNCLDKAEEYVLRLKDQVNGDWYYAILPIIKNLESSGSLLAASVCYRALVDSVLRRAKSKTYHHAVSYLKKLDRISAKVDDWKSIESHSSYLENLKKTHKLKYSFWDKYK